MIRVLITGANGQLGKELTTSAPEGYEVLSVSREEFDITDAKTISEVLDKFLPGVVINAAAYTKVDQAETDRESAHTVNADAPGYLAEACSKAGAALVHISTDFVFDGCSSTPYKIDSSTAPKNEYGRSKLMGEERILASSLENFAIIRTSWVYSRFGNNFVKTMLRLMESRDRLAVVGDQIGSPTSAYRLAKIIWQLVENAKAGDKIQLDVNEKVFHWSDLGVASWYDFAVAIQNEGLKRNLLSKKIPIDCIPSEQYPTPAYRPKFSVMDTSHMRALLSVDPSHWSCELANVMNMIAEDCESLNGVS